MFLQRLCLPFVRDVHVDADISRDVSPSLTRSTASDKGIVTDFHFVDRPAQSLSVLERQRFIANFESALQSLQAWSFQKAWVPTVPRKLRVVVAPEFRISRALVPAWEGRGGVIEFPAHRVAAGRAAIVHELAHVFFPNGNRFLAEGLAIYLQALLGENPAFPNFSQPLHEAARNRLHDLLPAVASGDAAALDSLHLASLDAIPTPNPLTLEIGGRFCGEDNNGQATLYCLAGSFVKFLSDAHGLALFRRLYVRTPLRAGELDAGSVNRWLEVYGRSLTELEATWKSLLTEMRVLSRVSG
jgi:hypothetical protein